MKQKYISVISGLILLLNMNVYSQKEKVIRDEWFAVYMMGMKVGSIHISLKENTEKSKKSYITRSETFLEIKHFSKTIEERIQSSVKENEAGKLVEFTSSVKGGMQDFQLEGKANGKYLNYIKKLDGKSEKKKIKLPSDLMMYYQLEKLQLKKGLNPGTTYQYKIFDPEKPDEFKTQKVTVKGKEKVAYFKEFMDLNLLEVQSEELPGIIQKVYLDDQFNTWMIDMGIMGMVFYRADQMTAQKKSLNDFSFLSFIQPSGSFNQSENIRTAQLKLSSLDGKLPDVPEDDYQKVAVDGNAIIISTTAKALPDEKKLISIDSKNMYEYLQANDLIQSEHPEIKNLSKKILGGETNLVKAVKKINQWVFQNIKKKNFNVLYDSALEVSRKLEGDCTEHSVLFAGLARAAGIPCKIVLGLVYLNGIYGYHQWVEVWLGDWYAMDPTLNQQSADATHLFLSKTSLNNTVSESLSLFLPTLKSIGNLKIEILGSKE